MDISPTMHNIPARRQELAVDLTERIVEEMGQAAAHVVPEFLGSMPAAYFNDTDHESLITHLKAIVATETMGLPQQLMLRSESPTRYTFVNERSYPGQLAELLAQIPCTKPLRSAKVHTATDGRLVLDVFEFDDEDPNVAAGATSSMEVEADLKSAMESVLPLLQAASVDVTADEIQQHLRRAAPDYVRTVPPRRVACHVRLCRILGGTEDSTVEAEPGRDEGTTLLTVGVSNADSRAMIQRIAQLLGSRGIDITRAHLDRFDHCAGSTVNLLSFVVRAPDGFLSAAKTWAELRRDLLRLRWLDRCVLDFSIDHDWSLPAAEVLFALARLSHQVLASASPSAFSRDRILDCVVRHLALARGVVEVFLRRADPDAPLAVEEVRARCEAVARRMENEVDGEADRRIVETMLSVVAATLSTNLAVEPRYALAIRLTPDFLSPDPKECPFATIFVSGVCFDGFHVRFRDIARGGVRVVRPLGHEQFTLESERLYDEVYGLAHAQNLKNKDIPEGGSKAVILVAPGAEVDRCGKAFASALLDLTVPVPEVRARVIGQPPDGELLFLGPDEGISDGLITWIVEHARRRGHPLPDTFMSSKPGAGINHKRYGVTSEGVTVFLDVALRSLGRDPHKEAFTITMTGGPDGDVAGNEIRILLREYGENARIVGVADGSGCAEDAGGLDHDELLRLVAAELPIRSFDPSRLGPGGRVVGTDEPGGAKLRNSLHNRLRADAFIPAGGRPDTIHGGNWQDFLDAEGKPLCPLIVEGANLFISPDAREALFRHGVLIVKDSSANKCGVICSSLEVLASMLLSETEFLEIKDTLVREIIIKLRELARREADVLFRERVHKAEVPLPELSDRVSRTIIKAADAATEALRMLSERDEDREALRDLVLQHLPPILRDTVGPRIFERAPSEYLYRTCAAELASRIVYREGLSYFETMPSSDVARVAVEYLHQERRVRDLAREVEDSSLPERELIAALLREGGAETARKLSSHTFHPGETVPSP